MKNTFLAFIFCFIFNQNAHAIIVKTMFQMQLFQKGKGKLLYNISEQNGQVSLDTDKQTCSILVNQSHGSAEYPCTIKSRGRIQSIFSKIDYGVVISSEDFKKILQDLTNDNESVSTPLNLNPRYENVLVTYFSLRKNHESLKHLNVKIKLESREGTYYVVVSTK